MTSALEYATLFLLQMGMAGIVLIVVTVLVVCLGALATYAVILLKHHLDERVAGLKEESRLWTRKNAEDLERMAR
jgi:hypothetical protein